MAKFYGTVRGQRGEASRLGGKQSGLTTVAASYSGAVQVSLFDKDGEEWADVQLIPWHGSGVHVQLYHGPVGKVYPGAFLTELPQRQ